MVTVLLGSLLERAILERSGQVIQEQIDRWKAENPKEARKLAAAAKRREATAKRKAEVKRLAQESQKPRRRRTSHHRTSHHSPPQRLSCWYHARLW
jgi:hypothetical protein